MSKILQSLVLRKILRENLHRLIKFFPRTQGDQTLSAVNCTYQYLMLSMRPPIINLFNPKNFNEKIIWLKTKYYHPKMPIYTDKVLVKDEIAKLIGSKYLIPTIGVYERAEDIDFHSLPSSFVIKANHGAGWNIIVKDKAKININKVISKLNSWLNKDYSLGRREYHYSKIKPKILIEKNLITEYNTKLNDFKIFCFNGVPKIVEVDLDRFNNHKRNFYNFNWERLPFQIIYPPYQGNINKPSNLDEMFTVAKVLSQEFPFLRVDLYNCSGKIYFGECTFTPGGGVSPIYPHEWNKKLGDWLELPSPNL